MDCALLSRGPRGGMACAGPSSSPSLHPLRCASPPPSPSLVLTRAPPSASRTCPRGAASPQPRASRRRRRLLAPLRVARPDPPAPAPYDPLAYKRRPASLDWWRSDWNPLCWDAEEWFQTHEHAPWVEHTLALIEEGWGNLNEYPLLQDEVQPMRVRAPASPAPKTAWEIYAMQQVDKRRAEEAASSLALWASIGEHTRTHHDTYARDIRVAERQKLVPNYRVKSEWSAEEIKELVAVPQEALDLKVLQVRDPRFKPSCRGLRPACPDEVEELRAMKRPDGSPRLYDDVSHLMFAKGYGDLADHFGMSGIVPLRSPRRDSFAPLDTNPDDLAQPPPPPAAGNVASATEEALLAVPVAEGEDDF